MKVEQIYTNCLAQGAYYIESNGEAAIIDPLREVQPYLDLMAQRGAKLKYIFETHFHADFVSGHVDLAKKTNAPIVYGPTSMETGFDITRGKDNQVFPLGNVSLTLIHTPGHTMESSCYLLKEESGKPMALFSGDTLFIGDVGRPDLAQHVIADLTEEKLAAFLYNSLRNKIIPLPDDIIVYPAHGAGSACGKNLSKETSDTLGNQKKTNYALNPALTQEAFIKEVLTGLMPPPSYFPKNVLMNIKGYTSVDEVIAQATTPIELNEFVLLKEDPQYLILDTRHANDYGKGFIPGSINIGVEGNFAVWVGTVIKDINQKLLLIVDPGKEKEVAVRLARVGYDQAVGFLEGGFGAWKEACLPIDTITTLPVGEFIHAVRQDEHLAVLDVRKQSEFDSEHLEGALNAPLDDVYTQMKKLNRDQTYYVHCAGGYRSMVFSSILRKHGFKKLFDVAGGFAAIKKSEKLKLSTYQKPVSML